MPGPLTKFRVVMFGSDPRLLEVRARVLATVGCETDLLYAAEDARVALEGKPRPVLLLICHTAEKEPAEEVRRLAQRTGVSTYYVERLLSPKQLLADVCAILRPNEQQQTRTANGCPPAQ
jgi:hypothetical protein